MSIAVGEIYTGVVTGITKFGAFVKLDEKNTGLVHISEVADTYVKEISDFLQVGQEVKVKVLTIADNGKVGLSIKKAQAPQPPQFHREDARRDGYGDRRNDNRRNDNRGDNRYENRNDNRNEGRSEGRGDNYYDNRSESRNERFENKLAEFMKDSNEKLTQLKRHQEGRRR